MRFFIGSYDLLTWPRSGDQASFREFGEGRLVFRQYAKGLTRYARVANELAPVEFDASRVLSWTVTTRTFALPRQFAARVAASPPLAAVSPHQYMKKFPAAARRICEIRRYDQMAHQLERVSAAL